MANVVSATDITVIVLDNDEASALSDLLYQHPTLNEDFRVLEDLTNAMLMPVKPKHPSLGDPRFEAVKEGYGMVMHPVCKQCGEFVFAVDGCKGHA